MSFLEGGAIIIVLFSSDDQGNILHILPYLFYMYRKDGRIIPEILNKFLHL
jgi:hypothetical protein